MNSAASQMFAKVWSIDLVQITYTQLICESKYKSSSLQFLNQHKREILTLSNSAVFTAVQNVITDMQMFTANCISQFHLFQS